MTLVPCKCTLHCADLVLLWRSGVAQGKGVVNARNRVEACKQRGLRRKKRMPRLYNAHPWMTPTGLEPVLPP